MALARSCGSEKVAMMHDREAGMINAAPTPKKARAAISAENAERKLAQEAEERSDARARTDQDDVLLRIGARAERLPRLVDPGPDLGAGRDPGEMIGGDALEPATAGPGRAVQHADDQGYLARRAFRRGPDRVVPGRHRFEQLEQFGAGDRAGGKLLQAFDHAERARLVRTGELFEPFPFRHTGIGVGQDRKSVV